MRYAICITTKGNTHVLRESLQSVVDMMPHEAKIHIVSADTSESEPGQLLRAFAAKHDALAPPKFVPGCSRGEGRRLAFEDAKANSPDFVIQSVDTDNVYAPMTRNLFRYHHDMPGARDVFLLARGLSVCAPDLMDTLGGWKEGWQVLEDKVVWYRAAQMGKFVFAPFDSLCTHENRRGWIGRQVEALHYKKHNKDMVALHGQDIVDFDPTHPKYHPKDAVWPRFAGITHG